ncbi:SDR family oxidoreductase [Candidatus Marinamargulisbacteria bacterium]|nr:SDR family oxidoreductase [Candidatus Marinamargulisbacteria bacterium]
MNTFLVTGGAGFIGSHLVEALLKQGHTVRILDNLSHGRLDNLSFLDHYPSDQYTWINGDIRDASCCAHAVQGVEYVLHQAALGSVPKSIEFPLDYHDNNVTGTLNILLAARDHGVKRVVQASSSSVYGDTVTLPKIETMTPAPLSPYALSKLTCEYYASMMQSVYHFPVVSLRYFNVFGPRQDPNSQYAAVIPKFVTAWLHNSAPVIHSDGEQTRDFTYIDNVVQANIHACFSDERSAGQVYNIGNGVNTSVNQLATTIQSLLGKDQSPVYEPARPGDVRDSLAAIERAQAEIGYEPTVQLAEGLKKTVAWYQALTHS